MPKSVVVELLLKHIKLEKKMAALDQFLDVFSRLFLKLAHKVFETIAKETVGKLILSRAFARIFLCQTREFLVHFRAHSSVENTIFIDVLVLFRLQIPVQFGAKSRRKCTKKSSKTYEKVVENVRKSRRKCA